VAFSAALEPRPGRSEVRTLYDSFEIFGKEGTFNIVSPMEFKGVERRKEAPVAPGPRLAHLSMVLAPLQI
jgi:hypothetical protein